MSNKIKKIEPEMEYPDCMGEESLQELKDNPFSGLQAHDIAFVMAMVIRKVNELVDAVNAPGDKGSVSENAKKSILQEDGEVLNGDRSIDYGDMKKFLDKIVEEHRQNKSKEAVIKCDEITYIALLKAVNSLIKENIYSVPTGPDPAFIHNRDITHTAIAYRGLTIHFISETPATITDNG